MKRFMLGSLILMAILPLATACCGSQATVVIPNSTGAVFRSNVNNALMAITTNQSGATSPSPTYAYMLWMDTSASPAILKIRNAANTGWVELVKFNAGFTTTLLVPYSGATQVVDLNNQLLQNVAGIVMTDGYINVGNITVGGTVQTAVVKLTSTDPGVCDSTNKGLIVYRGYGAGVKDLFQVCAKDASDNYVWTSLFTESRMALTPSATIALDAAKGDIFTLTPAQTCQINASNMASSPRMTLVITTSGTTSYTITFGTNFKTTGTLATGTVTAKQFTISFVFDGTNYVEVSRTTAM